jgi:O-antigen/teichoic acid export membrane protein/Mrp family chromosome partitioning ATPase
MGTNIYAWRSVGLLKSASRVSDRAARFARQAGSTPPMELNVLVKGVTRHLGATLAVFVLVVVACTAIGVLSERSDVASASALVQPTTADLGTEQYVLSVLPLRVGGTPFRQQVARSLPAPDSTAHVTLSAQANQTSGILIVTATGTNSAAAVAWADAALLTVQRITPVDIAQGVGIITLSHATLTSSADRKASLIDAAGLGALLAILAGILLEASWQRSSGPERIARRVGLPVIMQANRSSLPSRRREGRKLAAMLDGQDRPVMVFVSGVGCTDSSVAAVGAACDLALLGHRSTVIRLSGSDGPSTGEPSGSRIGVPLQQDRVEMRYVVGSRLRTSIDSQIARGRTVLVAGLPFGSGHPETLAPLMNGPLLVVTNPRTTTTDEAEGLTRRLQTLGLPVSGVVLSNISAKTASDRELELVEPTPDPQRSAMPEEADPSLHVPPIPPRSGLPARLVRNVLAVYGTVALAGISLLFITPFAIHRLGRSVYGVYALLQTVSEYILLGNVGFGTATLKLVAEDAGRDNRRVLRTFNTSVFVLTGFGVVVLLGSLGVTLFLPTLFGVPESLHTRTIISFAVLAIAVAPQLPGSALTGILMGYQRYDIEGLLECVGILVTGIGTVIAIVLGGGLVGAAIAIAMGYLVMVVIPWFPARRLVPGLRISRQLIDRGQLRRMTSLSGWYLVENVSNVVSAEVDLVLVGALLGIRQVAVFAVAFQLSRLATKAIGPFQAVFFPHVSSVSSSGDDEGQLREILRDGTRVTLAIAIPAALVVALLAKSALEAWVGSGFGQATAVVALLTIGGAITAFATVGTQILIGLGKARSASLIGGATAIVHVLVAVVLSSRYGTTGVALGTLASAGLVYAPATIVMAARFAGDTLLGWLRSAVLPHAPAAVVTSTFLILIRSELTAAPLEVIGTGILAFGVYLVVYLLIGATPPERSAVLSRLRLA